jgi:hypothetical protein
MKVTMNEEHKARVKHQRRIPGGRQSYVGKEAAKR